jgi:large subunit ribosomal protein L17
VDSTHNRRTVFAYLKSKEAVTELFREVAVKVGDRPGGYTRIIKTGNRLGDNAEMAMIELVDFNEVYGADKVAKKGTRRGRKKADAAVSEAVVAAPAVEAVAVEETPVSEAPVVDEAASSEDSETKE